MRLEPLPTSGHSGASPLARQLTRGPNQRLGWASGLSRSCPCDALRRCVMFFAVFLGQHAFPNGRGSGNESAHLAFPDYPPASPRLIPLIAHLLTKDPAARPSAASLLATLTTGECPNSAARGLLSFASPSRQLEACSRLHPLVFLVHPLKPASL
jgi:hypothetical protein